jgi:hypothetical protein
VSAASALIASRGATASREKEGLVLAAPLLASFKHLLSNEYHRQQRQKRGDLTTIVSLERE